MNKILITGATGHLGSRVIEGLVHEVSAADISVLARNESKAEELKRKGISVKVGNYLEKPSLLTALKNIDKLLLISSSDLNDRFGQHKNVIDAAKEMGVKHIFYTGVTMKNIEQSPLKPLLESHFQTEDYIKTSGITYTFLRNGLYAEAIPMFVGKGVFQTGVYFPAGDGKVAFATRKDLGEAIARILAGDDHEKKTYHLTSTTSYSFSDVATCISELSGQTVDYTDPPEQEFKTALKQSGLPEEIITMSVLFAAAIKNKEFDITDNTLETHLGRKQTDLKTFLKEAYNL